MLHTGLVSRKWDLYSCCGSKEATTIDLRNQRIARLSQLGRTGTAQPGTNTRCVGTTMNHGQRPSLLPASQWGPCPSPRPPPGSTAASFCPCIVWLRGEAVCFKFLKRANFACKFARWPLLSNSVKHLCAGLVSR